jgi:hypothetical protein
VCYTLGVRYLPKNTVIKTGNNEISELKVEEITVEVVEKAIRNLKNNKAAGTD